MFCCDGVWGRLRIVLLERSIYRICYWSMRYVELNSGGLQTSILSWMYILSVYVERVLVLIIGGYLFDSLMVLLEDLGMLLVGTGVGVVE